MNHFGKIHRLTLMGSQENSKINFLNGNMDVYQHVDPSNKD